MSDDVVMFVLSCNYEHSATIARVALETRNGPDDVMG